MAETFFHSKHWIVQFGTTVCVCVRGEVILIYYANECIVASLLLKLLTKIVCVTVTSLWVSLKVWQQSDLAEALYTDTGYDVPWQGTREDLVSEKEYGGYRFFFFFFHLPRSLFFHFSCSSAYVLFSCLSWLYTLPYSRDLCPLGEKWVLSLSWRKACSVCVLMLSVFCLLPDVFCFLCSFCCVQSPALWHTSTNAEPGQHPR